MNSHFSEEILRQNLDCLANRPTPSGRAKADGRTSCAEARFENDHTVLYRAYLAHLKRQPTN